MPPLSKSSRVYSVGVICALATEKAAVASMLDEEHNDVPKPAGDENDYTFGRMCDHHVAVACLPAGILGKASAATVAKDMMRSFPIKIGLLVGVAGGVWSKNKDIRLGDVVVSQPDRMHGGVVQWDFGKMERDGIFQRNGTLNKPPRVLLQALQTLRTREMMTGTPLVQHLAGLSLKFPRMAHTFCHQGVENDQLFESSYAHSSGDNCDLCNHSRLVIRPPRDDTEPRIHYGNIASGDKVMRDGPLRDKIAKEEDIMCFEMEAAGLTDSFPCVVIRGICDYADSHKNKSWQPYAAATAAAFAKLLLSVVDISRMDELPSARAINFEIPFSLEGVPATSRFVGREQELAMMQEKLLRHDKPSRRRKVFAIHGMGGMGKTQLAIEYARRHSKEYTAIIWINGESAAKLRQSLLDFIQRLPKEQISVPESTITSNTSKHTAADEVTIDDRHEVIAAEVLRWLSNESNFQWLLIVDNIDREHEPEVSSPSEPPFASIVKLFPPVDHGTILVTTRLVSLKSHFKHGLKLHAMTSEDSKAILGRQMANYPSETDELVRRLRGLPLALAQAAAFLEQTGMSPAAYIKHYDAKWDDLMQLQSRFPLREYHNGERSMLTTWALSYDQVKAQSKLAAKLLKFWAFLDCNDIWFRLVASAGSSPDTRRPKWISRLAKDELAFETALGLLHKFSLVHRKGSHQERPGYAVHAVLHNWCLYLNKDEAKEPSVWLAVCLIGATVPLGRSVSYRTLDRRLLPHILQIYRRLDEVGPAKTSHELTALLDITGVLIRQQRNVEAKSMAERVLQRAESHYGHEHEITLSAMHHMGWVYAELGSYSTAATFYKQTLQGKTKLYGSDHPSTLKTLRNLGHLLLKQGKHAQAHELYSDALTSMQRGVKSTVRSDILDSLGFTYVSMGSIPDALKMYEQALATKTKLLGPDHLSTLDTVTNLGILCMKLHQDDRAESYLRRALAGRMEDTALGQDHPETIATMRHLEKLLTRIGRPNDAVLAPWKSTEEEPTPSHCNGRRSSPGSSRAASDVDAGLELNIASGPDVISSHSRPLTLQVDLGTREGLFTGPGLDAGAPPLVFFPPPFAPPPPPPPPLPPPPLWPHTRTSVPVSAKTAVANPFAHQGFNGFDVSGMHANVSYRQHPVAEPLIHYGPGVNWHQTDVRHPAELVLDPRSQNPLDASQTYGYQYPPHQSRPRPQPHFYNRYR